MDSTVTMRTYRHDGPGGPVRATSAASAALALARRLYGSRGSVESLLFVARRWASNGYGGSKIAGKAWTAVVILPPDERQRLTGGYVVPRRELRITEGKQYSAGSDAGPGLRKPGSEPWQRAPVRPPVLRVTGVWRHIARPAVPPDAALEADHARLAREAAAAWRAVKTARRGLVGTL